MKQVYNNFDNMNEQQLQQVYEMIDSIAFSRVKRNINRDFSDGVMMAELIHHYNPKIISVHNYPASNALSKKIQNWKMLNTKILKKIGISLQKNQIQDIANAVPNAIQQVLYQILVKFQKPDEQVRLTHNARRNQRSEKGFKQGMKIQIFDEQNSTPYQNYQTKKSQSLEEEVVPDRFGMKYSVEGEPTVEEVTELLTKIDHATLQLSKLVELNKVKEDMVRNLQKKLQKILIS